MKKIRVVELFAGVGGFRLGLESASKKNGKVIYETVWNNQWEPGASTQHASEIYRLKFGNEGHSNEDIQQVIKNKFYEIADHDLLVGGFPCQDYSVARTLSQAEGLKGKKGVLWWSIYNILEKKGTKAPKYLMLENVDRLLKSPASQRGRDFAVMLASLAKLGYIVEWRVVNAADYGMPQRRRRVFILGYRKNTAIYKKIKKEKDHTSWITEIGVTASAFPAEKKNNGVVEFALDSDLARLTETFSAKKPTKTPFENAGIMIDEKVYTISVNPTYRGKKTLLRDIINDQENREAFFIKEKDMDKWRHLKGGKKEERKTKAGHVYHYAEGPISFPDSLDRPSRTIVTGEGGSGPSRFKHVILTDSGKLRRLTPEELEKLDMFPVGHTAFMLNSKPTPDTKRAFIMGNALVVGVIEKLGASLANFIVKEN